MANELTDAGEILALDFLNGRTATITAPLKLALVTAMGTDSSAGTEVTGGGYTRKDITFGAAAAGSASNSAAISFTNMPAVSVVGFEIWDSSGSPKRLWAIPRTGGAATVNAGDTLQVDVGGIVLSIN